MEHSGSPLLVIAHPGHELMLYGWLKRARPRVCVLTDGSGRGESSSRVRTTEALLASTGAAKGSLFAPFTDRRMYEALLAGDAEPFVGIAEKVASELETCNFAVADPAEEYNPVHDLCRWIVGAACEVTGKAHREYPLVYHPSTSDEVEALELDDVTFAEKLGHGRSMQPLQDDVDRLLTLYGVGVFQRESFVRAPAWDAPRTYTEPPHYEQVGRERVAAGHYTHVICYDEHMLPIRDALRQWARSHACVS